MIKLTYTTILLVLALCFTAYADECEYNPLIHQISAKKNVDKNLVKAIVSVESDCNPNAETWEPNVKDYSEGLMQVRVMNFRIMGNKEPKHKLRNPTTNLTYGITLLARILKQVNGNVEIAVAQWNAGASRKRPHDAKRDWDGEYINKHYVHKVMVQYYLFTAQEEDSK